MAFTILRSSTGKQEPENLLTVQIDSAEDLDNIPEYASPGSEAITANKLTRYVKSNNGTWTRATAGGGGSSGGSDEALLLADEALQAAQEAAAKADLVAAKADTADGKADDAAQAAGECAENIIMKDAEIRMIVSVFQAMIRDQEGRIAQLETRIAAMAGA